MTIYVKEMKEEFFTSGDTLPYRTRQTVMGYFMDEESCRRDSEAERDFYTSKSHYSDLFSKGKTIYMNTTINDRNHYTKMNYSWNPIPLLEVNHRGLSAEEFGAEDDYILLEDFEGNGMIVCSKDKEKVRMLLRNNFINLCLNTYAEHELYGMGLDLEILEQEGVEHPTIHEQLLRWFDSQTFAKQISWGGFRDESQLLKEGGFYTQGDAFIEPLTGLTRNWFVAEEFEAQEVDFWNQVAENKFSVIIHDTDSQKFYEGFVKEEEEFDAEGGSKCEGKKLKDSGYCALDFDYSSSGLTTECSGCGNEDFWNEYWDSNRISYTDPDEGQVLCAVKQGGKEDDLGYCSFDWDYGSGYAYADCDVCGTEVEASFENDFAEEDFSAEGINLRKRIEDLIDIRELNFTGFKKDSKRQAAKRGRRMENEIKGVLPKGKSYKVERPKWFKMVQTGMVIGVAGLIGYSGFKRKE